MTDTHYVIIGLAALALFVNRQKLVGLLAPPPSPVAPPTLRIVESAPPAPAPVDTTDLAALLHQQVQAKGTVRALERHVETMIEGEAGKVRLAFQPAPNSTPENGTNAPKS